MIWTKEAEQLLKEYSKQGFSASQIVELFKKNSIKDITRNSVIGKMNRMKLKSSHASRKIVAPFPNAEVAKTRDHFDVEIEGAKSLLEVGAYECRFMVKNGCCAQPTIENSPYCNYHTKITRG